MIEEINKEKQMHMRNECQFPRGKRLEIVSWFHLQIVFDVFIYFHDGGLITTSVTIVRGREYRDDMSFVGPIVTSHDQLMGSGDSS